MTTEMRRGWLYPLGTFALAALLVAFFIGGMRYQRHRDALAITPLIARLLVCEQRLEQETP